MRALLEVYAGCWKRSRVPHRVRGLRIGITGVSAVSASASFALFATDPAADCLGDYCGRPHLQALDSALAEFFRQHSRHSGLVADHSHGKPWGSLWSISERQPMAAQRHL